ncbi:MAG: hypothetical protein ABIN48_02320 [Ginsengibacter sp.]
MKRILLKVLFAILLIGGDYMYHGVYAQTPVVKTSVDKNEILIGQQIKFRVEISFPINTYHLEWFTLPNKLNHFDIVAKDDIDSSLNVDYNTFGQTIILTSFDSGKQFIPAMPLRITSIEGGKSFTMYTDSIPIIVRHSPLDNVQPFHDIKTIIEIKAGWAWWVWALIVAGVILLLILIAYLIKRFRKKKGEIPVFDSNLSPYEEAVQALLDLQKEELLKKGQEKEFHLGLSRIFKRFLSRKMNLNKMHLMTDDVLIELTPLGIQKSSISNLANSLRLGDVVKFAQHIPPVAESENCKKVVEEMILELNSSLDKNELNDR